MTVQKGRTRRGQHDNEDEQRSTKTEDKKLKAKSQATPDAKTMAKPKAAKVKADVKGPSKTNKSTARKVEVDEKGSSKIDDNKSNSARGKYRETATATGAATPQPKPDCLRAFFNRQHHQHMQV